MSKDQINEKYLVNFIAGLDVELKLLAKNTQPSPWYAMQIPGRVEDITKFKQLLPKLNCNNCIHKTNGRCRRHCSDVDSVPCESCVKNMCKDFLTVEPSESFYDALQTYSGNKADLQFKKAIRTILNEGVKDVNPRPVWKDPEGDVPAHSIFTTQYVETYDISKGEFPITTVKPTAWKTGIREMFWIYRGMSNDLPTARDEYGIKWWDEWNIGDDTIGYRYGHTVKRYDLMNKLIDGIKNNPYGRRHIINLWQEEEFKDETKGLNPCAFMTMWSVRGEYLDCTLTQRSNDVAMAYNINNIQYVALMMMVAKATGYKPGKFMRVVQNIHIYDRHIEACKEYLTRPISLKQPKLIFEPKSDNFFDFTIDDFRIEDYEPQPSIKLPIAV